MSYFSSISDSDIASIHSNQSMWTTFEKSNKRWIVQRYSSASVGTYAINIGKEIVPAFLDDYNIAIVCSAHTGSLTADSDTSNLLLRAASRVRRHRAGSLSSYSNQHPARYNPTADLLHLEYSNLATASIRNHDILENLQVEIREDCDWLRRFLFTCTDKYGRSSVDQPEDVILALGEKLSSKLLTAILLDHDIPAEFIAVEDIEGYINWHNEKDYLRSFSTALSLRVKDCGSKVSVITGFLGHIDDSRSLEGGFAEFLSSLLAVGLEAAELQVWDTVDGIFTADPEKVSSARLVESISQMEAAELALHGHPIISLFTLEQVASKNIPIKIKNVKNPSGTGTIIQPDLVALSGDLPFGKHGPWWVKSTIQAIDPQFGRRSTAVAVREHIVLMSITSNARITSPGFISETLALLNAYNVHIDLINAGHTQITFAFEDQTHDTDVELLAEELRHLGTVVVRYSMAILTLVGQQMRNTAGISGRVFSTLVQGGMHVEMIGCASESSMSCVIDGENTTRALQLIHQTSFRKLDGPSKLRSKSAVSENCMRIVI